MDGIEFAQVKMTGVVRFGGAIIVQQHHIREESAEAVAQHRGHDFAIEINDTQMTQLVLQIQIGCI